MRPTPEQILKILMDHYGLEREVIERDLLKSNGNLTANAGLSSLDVIELVMEIENKFEIVMEEGNDNFATMPFTEFMDRIAKAPEAFVPATEPAPVVAEPAPRYNAAGQRLTPAPHMAKYQPKDADDSVLWNPEGTKRLLFPRR